MSGYKIYRGLSAAELSLLESVGVDVTQITAVQTVGTTRYYSVTAVSDAGVESATGRTIAVGIDASGNLIGLAPNAVASCRAYASAAGAILVDLIYDAYGQSGVAATVKIARRILDMIGAGAQRKAYDWDNPLATVTVGRRVTQKAGVALSGAYEHNETLHLAARAYTAAVGADPAVAGPILRLDPVVAKVNAPPMRGKLIATCETN